MAKSKSTKGGSASNDGLALIIGGLFVLALVFATYSYFNRSNTLEGEIMSDSTERTTENNKKASLGERLKELFSGEDEDVNGTGGPVEETEDTDTTETTPDYSEWTATDYSQGDISGNTYTVKSGDTLWEIAEARYGNGAEWTKILDANSSDIGYLPNGSQALIVPGQTLVLP